MSRRFEDLVALQARLLDPDGCPWDREQTHQSLRTYLLEEAYEVLETLDGEDYDKLAGELGDLLLQVVFHAELARRAGRFEIGDVVEHIHNKLVRRHPHVFGDPEASRQARNAGPSPAHGGLRVNEVLKNWEQLKAEERKTANDSESGGEKTESLLDGIPRTLPATLEAYQLTRRASRIGFDWDDLDGLLDKLKEEVAELRGAMQEKHAARLEEEVGDLLFVTVNAARFLQVDPEIALKKANRKFQQRFRWMEESAASMGRKLADVPRDEMEQLWDRAKEMEKGAGSAGSTK